MAQDIYLDTLAVMDSLKRYASPRSKLTTMIDKGEVIRVRRGLYVAGGEDARYSKSTLANKVYGPSYISFEYALAYYGLIPERVENVTSASLNKNRSKRYNTPLGVYIYWPIPQKAFPCEVRRIEEGGNPFLIASQEKALCDTLYRRRKIVTVESLTTLLIEDMRMDMDILATLNKNVITRLSPLYGKRVHSLFAKWYIKEF